VLLSRRHVPTWTQQSISRCEQHTAALHHKYIPTHSTCHTLQWCSTCYSGVHDYIKFQTCTIWCNGMHPKLQESCQYVGNTLPCTGRAERLHCFSSDVLHFTRALSTCGTCSTTPCATL
jgi:hypothetical protein